MTPSLGSHLRGVLLTVLASGATLTPAAAQTIQYPPAPKGDVVDEYHGTKVPDPYRGLEDPDAPATRSWIEAENRLPEA
jgi:prolyl oligopeptidase